MELSYLTIAFHFVAAWVVQLLMLFQSGITYLLLRKRFRHFPLPVNLAPLNARPFITNKLVSVVIPAYNEAGCIKQTMQSVACRCTDPLNLEMVIIDAGGQDGTMVIVKEIAEQLTSKYGVSIRFDVTASGGRGPTLNAGAQVARGNILLFLHADTILPVGYDEMVRKELRNESILATAFRFKVARPEGCKPIVGIGVMEATVYIRSRVYELPFGDQAIAICRQRFDSIGGFPNEPIMEDFELVQKLRRCSAGGAGYIKTLLAPAECSARRWEKYGVWRTNLINQIVMIAYVYGGYSPSQIFDFYYKFDLSDWLLSKYEVMATNWCYYDHEGKHLNFSKQTGSDQSSEDVKNQGENKTTLTHDGQKWEKVGPS